MPNEIYMRIAKLREGKLTKSQRRLIDYFMSVDLRRAAYLSITELAQSTDVAEATVLRFCRALGFARYQQFRIALTEENAENEGAIADMGYLDVLEEDYRAAIARCKKLLSEANLAEACIMIMSAKAICCCGMGESRPAAAELHRNLMAMGILSYRERDFEAQSMLLSSCGAGDLLILFSGTGGKGAVELAELARANGMHILVISRLPVPQLARYADCMLNLSDGEDAQSENGAGRLAETFVSDAILAKLYGSDRGRYEAALARTRRVSGQT